MHTKPRSDALEWSVPFLPELTPVYGCKHDTTHTQLSRLQEAIGHKTRTLQLQSQHPFTALCQFLAHTFAHTRVCVCVHACMDVHFVYLLTVNYNLSRSLDVTNI